MTIYLRDADSLTALAHVEKSTDTSYYGTTPFRDIEGLKVTFMRNAPAGETSMRFLPGYTLGDIKREEETGLTVIDATDAAIRRETAITGAHGMQMA